MLRSATFMSSELDGLTPGLKNVPNTESKHGEDDVDCSVDVKDFDV